MDFIVIFGLVLVILSPTNGLECGMNSGFNTTELKVVLTTCLSKEIFGIDRNNKNKTEKNDYSNEYDDSYFYNDDFLEEKVNKTETNFNKNENNNKEMMTTENFSDIFNQEPGRCTYHCIFKKLNIVDEDGFPDHDKVSQNLIIEARNKELKDFFQDSVDECFQLTQGEELEVCDFSYNFFKCLAEKARENCSDWSLDNPLLFDLF